MILSVEELTKLIAEYEKKSEEAYRNYQDTGNGRYWSTHRKYEDLADTLKVAREYRDKHLRRSDAESAIRRWAGVVADMPWYTAERREAEAKRILGEILEMRGKV